MQFKNYSIKQEIAYSNRPNNKNASINVQQQETIIKNAAIKNGDIQENNKITAHK